MGKNKTKNGRSLNPADAYRKQQRQKEIKKNKVQKQKVRTLILQTKTSSKIQTQIDEITAAEANGELDKKQKTKKKILQDTLAKVIELEKLKGDNLQEEDLMGIPHYIDFTQGPITLSDKPKEPKQKPPLVITPNPNAPRPTLNINSLPNTISLSSLPPPPSDPTNAPFDLPPPPTEPLPDEEQPPLPTEQPPLPTEDYNSIPPHANQINNTNYPLPSNNSNYPLLWNPNSGQFPPQQQQQQLQQQRPIIPISNMNNANNMPLMPNLPFQQQLQQQQLQQQLYQLQQKQLQQQQSEIASQYQLGQSQLGQKSAQTISHQPAMITNSHNNATDGAERKFLAKPSALKVKRPQLNNNVQKKVRIDTAAASLVGITLNQQQHQLQQQHVQQQKLQQQQKEQEEGLEEDFENYMNEIAALGVL